MMLAALTFTGGGCKRTGSSGSLNGLLGRKGTVFGASRSVGQQLGKNSQAKLAAQTLTIAVTARDKLVGAARAFEHVFACAVTATTRLTVGE